jgi:ribosomal protein S18 acetylase RimI-like enzyme
MQLSIREATVDDRQRLANLIHFELYVHRHLDWRTPLDWIGYQPYWVAEHNREIVAALACPADPPEVAWIRLFAAKSEVPVGQAWQALWSAASTQLAVQGNPHAAAIVLQRWFSDLLEASGFVHTDNVVILMWEPNTELQSPKSSTAMILPMKPSDLEAVYELDTNAFEIEWRNSFSALELAYHQAALATVVKDAAGIIVGYQISTSSQIGGHLARLAVRKDVQGRGIGYSLVYDVLKAYQQRGINHVTVNTQQDNLASLAVYARAGFTRTDEQYLVYQYFSS